MLLNNYKFCGVSLQWTTKKYKCSIDGLYDASRSHDLGSRYKFGGKEVVSGVYDFGARYYYPAIGRFMGVDPLAEDYAGVSPYAYVLNDPLKLIDPTGMSVETVNNEYIFNVRTGTHTKISDYGGDAFDEIHVKGADSPLYKDFENVPEPFGTYSYRVLINGQDDREYI